MQRILRTLRVLGVSLKANNKIAVGEFLEMPKIV